MIAQPSQHAEMVPQRRLSLQGRAAFSPQLCDKFSLFEDVLFLDCNELERQREFVLSAAVACHYVSFKSTRFSAKLLELLAQLLLASQCQRKPVSA
jgi:hypothetical protein